MTEKNENSASNLASRLLNNGLDLPWLSIGRAGWQLAQNLWQRRRNQGMYEVLEYESTLELLDPRGERAHFKKREKIRYLQDNIIAYQDFAWGDGQILLNYRCSPGKVVDRWRPGQTTYLLISLRESKKRGDIDEFHIEWDIRNGFRRDTEQWETHFVNATDSFRADTIFPKERPPIQARVRARRMAEIASDKLPDGRYILSWQVKAPEHNIPYVVQWQW